MNHETSILTRIGDETLTEAEVHEFFNHIELSEQEKAVAFLNAYKQKCLVLQEEEKQMAREAHIFKHKAMWTFDDCYAYALAAGETIGRQRNFNFILDEDNKDVFRLLALYFSNDPRFEEETWLGESLKLHKGICLISPVRGNGKTTLLDCFMWNKRGCYTKMSTKKMADFYNEYGLLQIKKMMWLVEAPAQPINFYQHEYGFHYDDFGDEMEVMHMGQRKRISADIINNIYDNHRDDNQFHRFHISMNYKWSEYEKNFGSNTASRLNECFNLIKVPGESRRTPKKR